jgi:hypothetical protein
VKNWLILSYKTTSYAEFTVVNVKKDRYIKSCGLLYRARPTNKKSRLHCCERDFF